MKNIDNFKKSTNEIAQLAMKSANVDEIKSVPSHDEVGFHHEVISSTQV